jgi:hypothetical protein
MPKSKSKKEEPFNWKGIKDNGDGTFDVADKHAKNRLMKEFRRQGIRARSKRLGEKGFVIYPGGARKQRARGAGRMPKKERQYYPGTKPSTRVRVTGPRPQLRQGRPGFSGPMIGRPYPGRPVIQGGITKGVVKGARGIMTAAGKRAQKKQLEQRSPYDEQGKPRPGYFTYVDKTGTQRIIKRPTGTWRDKFMSKSQKEAVHQARVQESVKIEEEMKERSKGQPSTRISEPHRVPGGIIRQHAAPAGVTRSSELPERKVNQQDLQQKRAAHIQRTTELPPEKTGEQ